MRGDIATVRIESPIGLLRATTGGYCALGRAPLGGALTAISGIDADSAFAHAPAHAAVVVLNGDTPAPPLRRRV